MRPTREYHSAIYVIHLEEGKLSVNVKEVGAKRRKRSQEVCRESTEAVGFQGGGVETR